MNANKKQAVVLFWFRRDLRLNDNVGLHQALQEKKPVLPVFIFDKCITEELPHNDPRLTFIYDQLHKINSTLNSHGSGMLCLKGDPKAVWKSLIEQYQITAVYTNEDYEPYAIHRDESIKQLLMKENIPFHSCKDQVVFAKNDILKPNKTPYSVFTPYKKRWLSNLNSELLKNHSVSRWDKYLQWVTNFPSMKSLELSRSNIQVQNYQTKGLDNYEATRNFPSLDETSKLSPHLRFGTVSIRQLVTKLQHNAVFLSELIWREFFMQILFHYPQVVTKNFKSKYDGIQWRDNQEDFEKWCAGETGYPMVDAGMRELNATGYMHNRVRMVTAGFLCKHLLIDWRWGEAYFAKKLLDYELSSNNGNWQWAAGTGCDSAPYFRIFNPTEQVKKFDKKLIYIKKWISEYESLSYPNPMVEHKFARARALEGYKKGLLVKTP
jgi:deoxyribodipyrimidine photo-lyase